uniref:M16 family metallopeptidase n=1 Tax=Butyrivibrio sp. NC3005 TaxID=1280685 RepID=UPI00047C562D
KIPGAKTIACGLWVAQGSKNESDSNSGLSHLVEHLVVNPVTSGNEVYQRLIEEATNSGVVYNAATTKEYTCFYFTGLSNTLDLCVKCLSNIAMNNRVFPKDMFENEKKVVIQEATSFYSSFQQIKERTSQALWGNMGIGRIIMGNISNIQNATLEQVNEILDMNYIPERSSVVIVGDIDYGRALELIGSDFDSWKDKHCGEVPELVDSEPGVYLNKGSGASSVVSIGFRTGGYSMMQRQAIEMMVRILGQSGLKSRIVDEVRMKRGLAYNVGGFYSVYKNHGTIGFMSVCDKEKTVDVAKVMMDTILHAKKEGFTDEEIEREKKMMETTMLLSVDNITDHLRNIGRCDIMGSDFYIENEIRGIRSITKELVNHVADEIIQEANLGLALIGECDNDLLLNTVSI